jgi:hypothetical protein
LTFLQRDNSDKNYDSQIGKTKLIIIIIIIGVFRKWEGVVGTGWSGLRIGTVGGHL